jgi:DNA-binding NarL/FixJ family response regulator
MVAPGVKPNRQARVLVVDDHPLVREGLMAMISRHRDFICCGEADSVAGTQKAVESCKPDLLLLDLRLRSGDGLDLIKTLQSAFPSLRILVISQFDEAVYAERALRAGARGYVMKQQATQEVLTAMRTILAGELYVSPRIAALALHKMVETKPVVPGSGIESLTDRELQVFRLLGGRLSTRQIAAELHLSFKTVETHRENIKHKLRLTGAAELVRYATEWVDGLNPSQARRDSAQSRDLQL